MIFLAVEAIPSLGDYLGELLCSGSHSVIPLVPRILSLCFDFRIETLSTRPGRYKDVLSLSHIKAIHSCVDTRRILRAVDDNTIQ